MSRLGGQSESRPPVFKSPSKLLVLIYRPTAVVMKARPLGNAAASTNNYARECVAQARWCIRTLIDCVVKPLPYYIPVGGLNVAVA
ncbi:hypothetical protein TNCV_4994601 [Trichonephila clavipes]|nr:hypothetical protein TNCV_4994601 [Trichonephila clavipes]